MEPMLPGSRHKQLLELAAQIASESAALGASLPQATREGLTSFLRNINSYYSNLIEGHGTHPRDVERALKQDFSASPQKRALQIESAAHVKTQMLVEERLTAEPALDVCSTDFLCWIHREFYQRMPPEFASVKDSRGRERPIVPGALRTSDVSVGSPGSIPFSTATGA